DERDKALELAQQALRYWPARTRHIGVSGLRKMSAVLCCPSWSLARSLCLVTGPGDEETIPILKDLTSDANGRRLRRLTMVMCSRSTLHMLRPASSFPRLSSLRLSLGPEVARRDVMRLLRAELSPRLRSISIDGMIWLDREAMEN